MDFDLSKENIQPLRSGRNIEQLSVALQAQSNEEYHQELMEQKEHYENEIRNYSGDDPLDNWYQYISWVEQSFPKHGHEGNFISLLEDCISKFENDTRYTNDQRFCKLWIKYIDLQQNPLELYHMMHTNGLCRGCAEFYKAWSYYHEAAGDYRSANMVFEVGKKELAQPYEELERAHENLIIAAGQHMISGVDERRLVEKRQALTALYTYKPGKVGSIRKGNPAGPGILPCSSNVHKSNAVPVYISEREAMQGEGAAAVPVSILSVAKRREAAKENILKPGPWSVRPSKKPAYNVHHTPAFTVHEDDFENQIKGINLPTDYYPITHEDYSNFILPLCCPDPPDDTKIPMYPKSQVYREEGREYSIEEIKSQRYMAMKNIRLNVSHVEIAQAVQSIIGEDIQRQLNENEQLIQINGTQQISPNIILQNTNYDINYLQNRNESQIHYSQQFQQPTLNTQNLFHHQIQQDLYQNPIHPHNTPYEQHNHNPSITQIIQEPQQHSYHQQMPEQNYNHLHTLETINMQQVKPNLKINSWSPHQQQPSYSSQHQNSMSMALSDVWHSPTHNSFSTSMMAPKPNVPKFNIFEESAIAPREQIQPKGSAMITPFKILTDEDLAETGSRGGLDVAAAAQPIDSAKRLVIFEDDSSSSFTEVAPYNDKESDFDTSCNTHMFNFNLNAMKVSTPQNKQQTVVNTDEDTNKAACKQLFAAPSSNPLSPIMEETKSYRSSSSGSLSKLNTLSHLKPTSMAVISEEHNNYLAENLQANAALRSTLHLFMECESQQSSPVKEDPYPAIELPPVVVKPLQTPPSDPFKNSLINTLLERVSFPGRHINGYITISSLPRLIVKKEPIKIGEERYIVDKQLGKGTYGTVFKGLNLFTNRVCALKIQKPPNRWEFYICRELRSRLSNHPLRDRYMDVQVGYFSNQASILISDFCRCGSLLNVANAYKQKLGRTAMKESLCIYFCIDMLKIITAMHKVQIVHADVKPDNFLVQLAPDDTVLLQLIDFGCSIDMSLFPPGTAFKRRVNTEDFVCCEMRDGRPWSYHTDLFCVAATAHVLLFDKYIQLQKRDGLWSITQRLSRYMRLDLWNTFFSNLLNQQTGIADGESLISFLEESLQNQSEDFTKDMRALVNLLKNR